jgi:hypothetical protein
MRTGISITAIQVFQILAGLSVTKGLAAVIAKVWWEWSMW